MTREPDQLDASERAAALQTALEDLLHHLRVMELEWRFDDRIRLAARIQRPPRSAQPSGSD